MESGAGVGEISEEKRPEAVHAWNTSKEAHQRL